ARVLITQPQPNFPSSQIFGEGVVEEIIRITGRHPFLIQAVCEILINNMNKEDRQRVEIQDIIIAVDKMFNTWAGDFRDLWVRTNQEQRICLSIIKELGDAKSTQVEQRSGFDKRTARDVVQTLVKRDLVVSTNDNY